MSEPFLWPEMSSSTQRFCKSATSSVVFSEIGKPIWFNAIEESKRHVLSRRPSTPYVHPERFKEGVFSFLLGQSGDFHSSLLDRSCVVATATSFSTYRLVAEFLRFTRLCPQVFLPFCGNSIEHVVRSAGLRGTQYRLFDHRTGDWQFGGTCEDMLRAGKNACFLVPFNGSTPFAVHLSSREWEQLTSICRDRNHLLWLDIDMFGLAGHPLDWDSELQCLWTILQSGTTCLLSLSLQHSLGLYENDLGAVVAVEAGADSAEHHLSAVENTLRRCAWELGCTAPRWMEQVVENVMLSPALLAEWKGECVGHRERFEAVRKELVMLYEKAGENAYGYQYLLNQTGPFSRVTYYRHRNEELMKELGRYGVLNLSSMVDCERDYPLFPKSLLPK